MPANRLNIRPYKPTDDFDYRVGRTSGNLLRLRDIGVPVPDMVVYFPYAVSYIRGDLSRVGDGEARLEWIWDIISIAELDRLTTMFFTSATQSYADLRYIKTDLRTGDISNPQVGFATYTCTVYRPNLSGEEGTPVTRSAHAYQSVKFIFTNLEVV